MTDAEAKLIELMLDIKHLLDENVVPAMRSAIEAVRAERSRHPYGSIAESMMVEADEDPPFDPARLRAAFFGDRDVFDPAPMQVSTSSISRTTLTDRYDVRVPRYDDPPLSGDPPY